MKNITQHGLQLLMTFKGGWQSTS